MAHHRNRQNSLCRQSFTMLLSAQDNQKYADITGSASPARRQPHSAVAYEPLSCQSREDFQQQRCQQGCSRGFLSAAFKQVAGQRPKEFTMQLCKPPSSGNAISHVVLNAGCTCKGADLFPERLWLGWFGSRNDIAGSYVLGPVPHSRDFSDEAQHRLHCQLSDSHDEHLTRQLQQLFHLLFAVNLQDLGSLVPHTPQSIIDQCGPSSQSSAFTIDQPKLTRAQSHGSSRHHI